MNKRLKRREKKRGKRERIKRKKVIERKEILVYNKTDMKKQTLYLDTTIINFALEEDKLANERLATRLQIGRAHV